MGLYSNGSSELGRTQRAGLSGSTAGTGGCIHVTSCDECDSLKRYNEIVWRTRTVIISGERTDERCARVADWFSTTSLLLRKFRSVSS